jgi:hypothetical protein
MSSFVGRSAELAMLSRRLGRVVASGTGIAVAVRGRRQVGKSRLVQEFCDQAGVPYFFFAAIKGASAVGAVREFYSELGRSSLLRDGDLVSSGSSGGWPDAFRALASALPDRPAVVVLDEIPWLAEQDDLFHGALRTAWDRLLEKRPVLLLLLGSDLHMMERLTAYDRPFYGPADNLILGPLNPAEVGEAIGLDAADAIDAQLVSGGLPSVLRAWPAATPALPFLEQECADPASALFTAPESSLLAEFAAPDQARRVLEAIAGGNRTHTDIAVTAGSGQRALPSGSLSPLLHRLVEEKRVLAIDEPLSTRSGKPALYRIADSNLRLYLAILRGAQEQARRGRPDAAFALVQRQWAAWRGQAVKPLVRQSLALAATAGALPWDKVETVGGWWNRQFNPEVDLVGADRGPVARQISFVGSIKWLSSPFARHDLASLTSAAPQVPGFSLGGTGLVVASRSGIARDVSAEMIGLLWGPDQVIGAWQQ